MWAADGADAVPSPSAVWYFALEVEKIAEKKLYENLVRWLSVMWRATRRTRDVERATHDLF